MDEIDAGVGGLAPAQLRRVIAFIHDRLSYDISLADLARVAGLGTSAFSRAFKQATGMPPYKYLLRLRVEWARSLLAMTRASIAEIALECGFCHQEHLTTAFRA